jgi:prepilin-type N-terminal cleavage/methylation domain-containing protein
MTIKCNLQPSGILTKKNAFSLIELMVVIAIVGVLAAISVSAYKQYILKVEVTKSISIISNVLNIAMDNYQKSSTFDVPVFFNGIDVNQNGWAYFPVQNIFSLEYFCPAHYNIPGFTPGDIFIDAALLGLDGIPGYIAPSGVAYSTGKYSIVSIAARDINGVMEIKCGPRDGTSDSIPLEFMPSGCSCADVRAWFFGTGSC